MCQAPGDEGGAAGNAAWWGSQRHRPSFCLVSPLSPAIMTLPSEPAGSVNGVQLQGRDPGGIGTLTVKGHLQRPAARLSLEPQEDGTQVVHRRDFQGVSVWRAPAASLPWVCVLETTQGTVLGDPCSPRHPRGPGTTGLEKDVHGTFRREQEGKPRRKKHKRLLFFSSFNREGRRATCI